MYLKQRFHHKLVINFHIFQNRIHVSMCYKWKFELPQSKNRKSKKMIAYSAPFLWNSSTSVNESNKTNMFKTNITNYTFYSSHHMINEVYNSFFYV